MYFMEALQPFVVCFIEAVCEIKYRFILRGRNHMTELNFKFWVY